MADKEFPANSCPVPNGVLLVIGGHEDKEGTSAATLTRHGDQGMEILKTFLQLTGKKAASIEVVTTASSEGKESFADYEKAFKKLGAGSIGHIHHDRRAEALSFSQEDRIRKADAVFFAGGDQLKLTSIYGGTVFLLTLKQRYIYDQLIVAGTSAGAMALSTPMIYAGSEERQEYTGEVKITTGLEFLKDVCVDTHFVDRSRFVRMSQVIASNPTSIGIGIEENTAVVVRNGLELDVIGDGIVIVVEGHHITDSNILDYSRGKTIVVHDLNVKLLSKGSTYMIRQFNPPHL